MKKRSHRKFMNRREGLRHQPFWTGLAVIFLLSTITLLTWQREHPLTGRVAIQTIAYLQAGQQELFEVKNIPGMQYLRVQIKETVKGGKILFEEKNIPLQGKEYSKFTITSEHANSFGATELTLKVEKEKLSFSPEELRLYIDAAEFQPLFQKQDERYYYYFLALPSFHAGEYVIGREDKITPKIVAPEAPPVPETPGQEPIATPVPAEIQEPANIAGKASYPREKLTFWENFWEKFKKWLRPLE